MGPGERRGPASRRWRVRVGSRPSPPRDPQPETSPCRRRPGPSPGASSSASRRRGTRPSRRSRRSEPRGRDPSARTRTRGCSPRIGVWRAKTPNFATRSTRTRRSTRGERPGPRPRRGVAEEDERARDEAAEGDLDASSTRAADRLASMSASGLRLRGIRRRGRDRRDSGGTGSRRRRRRWTGSRRRRRGWSGTTTSKRSPSGSSRGEGRNPAVAGIGSSSRGFVRGGEGVVVGTGGFSCFS